MGRNKSQYTTQDKDIVTSYHTYYVQIGLFVLGVSVVGSELGLFVIGDTEGD